MGVGTNGKDKELYEIVAQVAKDTVNDTVLRGISGEALIKAILNRKDVRLKDKLPRTQKRRVNIVKKALEKAVQENLLVIDIDQSRFVFK